MQKRRGYFNHSFFDSPEENLEEISLMEEQPWKPQSNKEIKIAAWNEEYIKKGDLQIDNTTNQIEVSVEKSCPPSLCKLYNTVSGYTSKYSNKHQLNSKLMDSFMSRNKSLTQKINEHCCENIKVNKSLASKPTHRNYLRKKSGDQIRRKQEQERGIRTRSIQRVTYPLLLNNTSDFNPFQDKSSKIGRIFNLIHNRTHNK